jgi:pyruvate-formate lyase-activating enzyme
MIKKFSFVELIPRELTNMTNTDSNHDDTGSELHPNAAGRHGRYLSCRALESGIFVSGKEIKVCCMANIGNRESPVLGRISSAQSSNTSVEQLIATRQQIRLANQTADAPCKGCYLLTDGSWKNDNRIETVAIAGFLHCNLACGYCTSYATASDGRDSGIASLLREWLDERFIGPWTKIGLGGGEPTLHAEFEALCTLAFSNRIVLKANTNCTRLSRSLIHALQCGLGEVSCSIDAGTQESFIQIKGKDFYTRVWNNVAAYAAAQKFPHQVEVKYIVMDRNSSTAELDEFVSALARSGAKFLVVSINSNLHQRPDGHLKEGIIDGCAYLLARAAQHGITINLASVISQAANKKIRTKAADIQLTHCTAPSHPDISRPVEIAYMENNTFIDRVATALNQKYLFKITFTSPCPDDELPDMTLAAIKLLFPERKKPLASFFWCGESWRHLLRIRRALAKPGAYLAKNMQNKIPYTYQARWSIKFERYGKGITGITFFPEQRTRAAFISPTNNIHQFLMRYWNRR